MLIHDDDDNCDVFVDCNYNPIVTTTTTDRQPIDDPALNDQNISWPTAGVNNNDIIDFKPSSDDCLFDCNFLVSTEPVVGRIMVVNPGDCLKTTHVTGTGISHEVVSS